MYSVCSILYGDYPSLAKSLLNSFQHLDDIFDFRLGLNSVSEATKDIVFSWADKISCEKPVYILEEAQFSNVGKYPLMRQLFKVSSLPSHIMWFDDDSYLDSAVDADWWAELKNLSGSFTQLGSVHSIVQRGKQFEAIPQQPWFTGKPLNPKYRFRFATGGWWVIESDFVVKHDYPFKEIFHNGGDSILGELIRQQEAILKNFPLVCCHCESCSKKGLKFGEPVVHINVGGRKGRRGIGVTGERYVWSDGKTDIDLSHQVFNMKVYSYGV